ncbi:MAG: hypothetical protein ABL878_00960 [Burkholderiales bacterium]
MKLLRWTAGLLVIPLALFAAYAWLVLNWSYSEGERAGYVQKLSKKGWICKTWEGELALVTMPGTVGEKFYFTVRSDEVADQINRSIGRRVALRYEEHVGIPTNCFGDTRYFVNAIQLIDEPAPLQSVPTATPPESSIPSDAPGPTEPKK